MAKLSDQINVLLKNVVNTNGLVFFVGAGMSVPAGYPLWGAATQSALNSAKAKGLSAAAAGYAEEKYQKEQYYEVFEILKGELPEPAFYEIAVTAFTGSEQPAETHCLLARINCRGIITTNFDMCLESACVSERKSMPLQDLPQAMASDRFFVLKPHGSILVPRTMVLTRSDWKQVADNRGFRELLSQCVSLNQIVFMGYSMRDPDFNRIWDEILRERIFRSPAIYCCSEGALRSDQFEEFRQRNVTIIEFPDDGSFAFIPGVLHALAKPSLAPAGPVVSAKPQQVAQELEHYVLMCLQFSPIQQSRLVLVAKALVLEMLVLSSADLIEIRSVHRYVAETLGQDSPTVQDAAKTAVQELADAKFLKLEGGSVRVSKDKVRVLNEQGVKLERAQAEWVERAHCCPN